ncbi:hypothetical protein I6F35_33605 [Bradyrhizobium sp. BRP22]|uniref:hypothetical protein n=1 Tax=Bradyrhizobium sp. BRP22 TaxID=2793821 RepID=UPI001CD5DEDB|nr:hypothetical protein [Bradyrhizobium sp. BRP22]MCA1458072.1 hypothetical protein [Bradyrhizobium sp. BRP22]
MRRSPEAAERGKLITDTLANVEKALGPKQIAQAKVLASKLILAGFAVTPLPPHPTDQ